MGHGGTACAAFRGTGQWMAASVATKTSDKWFDRNGMDAFTGTDGFRGQQVMWRPC